MSRVDEIRAELKAEAKRMEPFLDAQAARVQKIFDEGRIDEVIRNAFTYTEEDREMDRRTIERYEQGLNPGDMDLIDITVEEYIDILRKRVEQR